MRSLLKQMDGYGRVQRILWAVILIALVGFYLLAYRPGIRRLASLRTQIQSRQQELEQKQSRARNLPSLALQVGKLEQRVAVYDRQFPRQPNLGQFIKDITQISQQLSLHELKLQPLAPKKADGYFEQPISISFQGDFLNAASFLRQVEDLQRLTRVRRLAIKNKAGKAGVVDVTDMVASIYFSEG